MDAYMPKPVKVKEIRPLLQSVIERKPVDMQTPANNIMEQPPEKDAVAIVARIDMEEALERLARPGGS